MRKTGRFDIRLIGCVLPAVALLGCVVDDESPEELGTETSAIVDPTPAGLGFLPGAVRVQPGGCSGNAISADTVITAAHCFCTDAVVGGNVCSNTATVMYRQAPAPFNTPGGSVSGTATIHPSYNPTVDGQLEHDLAIIKLDGVLPAHVVPFEVASTEPAIGTWMIAAGYGKTGPSSGDDCATNSSGNLNYDYAKIDEYLDGGEFMVFNRDVQCPGDSGGPVVSSAAQNTLFAVHSGWRDLAYTPYQELNTTTVTHFDWIKGKMCLSSPANACNGDASSCACTASTDIVWQQNTGQVAIWRMNGDVASDTYPATSDGDWQLQGTGDFNGDGDGDILWRNQNGQLTIWYMTSGWIANAGWPGQPPLWWTIQGIGDFDGDSRSDILWRDTAGQLAIWFKGEYPGAAYPTYRNQPEPVHDLNWSPIGVGDFNGDTRADILWKHQNGAVAIWYMNGGTWIGDSYPGTATGTFQGIGDFDGDLRADVLWRYASGPDYAAYETWFDGHYRAWWSYTNVASASVEGIGDFDHDGRADVLWRDGTQITIWTMDGVRRRAILWPHFAGSGPQPVWSDWQIRKLVHNSGL